jgi:cytochrome P450
MVFGAQAALQGLWLTTKCALILVVVPYVLYCFLY